MQAYTANLKQISGNILLLYRNFLHWNLSKVLIFLYANITGFVTSLPFVGIIVYQYLSVYSKLGVSMDPEEFLLGNMGTVTITVLVFLGILTIFICTYTYGNFLLQNVYKSYLAGEKLPYTANLYFSWKHFRAYIGILGWISLYLLAPITIGLILIVPFGIFAKMSLGLSTFLVGGVSLTIFIALFVWLIALMIRLIFSSYILLYSEEVAKAKMYIDESFRLTKRKVWKIIFLIFPFLFTLGVLAGSLQIGEEGLLKNRIHTKLLEIQSQSGQDDHKLLEGFFAGNENEKEEFGAIEKAFSPVNNGIDREFLSSSLPYLDTGAIDTNWWIFSSIFLLLSFLLFEGLPSMIYLSVYHTIKGRKE